MSSVHEEFAAADHRAIPGAVSAVGYRMRGLEEGVHLGVPGATLTFIISLDGPVVAAASAPDLEAGDAEVADVVLAGLHLDAAHVRRPSHQEGVQLALDPLACRALFGCPAAELTSVLGPGADVLGPRGRALWQRVGETAGWAGRFAVLGDELTRRVAAPTTRSPRAEVVAAWRLLRSRGGAVRVEDVAAAVGLSPRQLRAEFTRELGVTPKEAARLFRLDRVLAMLTGAVRRGSTPVLADVAAVCGFSDQSHLAREFSGFLGVAPSAWLAQERRNIQAGGHAGHPGWES